MAAKTSVFYLTERITLDTTNAGTDTIDLGAYVDVADRQGVLVHSVDWIVQGTQADAGVPGDLGGSAMVTMQLTDLNRGDFVFADDRSLVSSGSIFYDTDGGSDNTYDLYPDNFGPTSAQGGRIVINDQMYVRARTTALDTGNNKELNVTCRIKCSVISLSQKDFMAIALQSTAADN